MLLYVCSMGIVGEVKCRGVLFARKRLFTTGREREKILRETRKEFDVLNRLKHRRIISVVEIFLDKDRINITSLRWQTLI